MKFVDEYRDPHLTQQYIDALIRITHHPWNIMEICGGQTHSIVKFGLDQLIPDKINLIHGPGCPVCVTSIDLIDQAIALTKNPDIILCSFGDMLRVPGRDRDLRSAKAQGGDVRIVYSPLGALRIARQHPNREVVFFAVGFETTAPATAMAVYEAKRTKTDNFSMLVAHVRVPPAMEAILSAPNCQVQGFLAAGHVCTVMGYEEYWNISKTYQVPIVVTGFEPVDILQGLYRCVQQLEQGCATVDNQYQRVVKAQGNSDAQALMNEVFEVVPRHWRGMGTIPQSGLGLRSAYRSFDAQKRFPLFSHLDRIKALSQASPSACISGEILQGHKKPCQCPAFGRECTPEHPLGAPMVSSEGACAAYYRYRHYHS